MLYTVYVLVNVQGRRYIGVTENVQHRLAQHNAGESKWTAKYGPWSLHWSSPPMPLGEARRLENLLKRQKGGRGLDALLILHGHFEGDAAPGS